MIYRLTPNGHAGNENTARLEGFRGVCSTLSGQAVASQQAKC